MLGIREFLYKLTEFPLLFELCTTDAGLPYEDSIELLTFGSIKWAVYLKGKVGSCSIKVLLGNDLRILDYLMFGELRLFMPELLKLLLLDASECFD